MIFIIKGFRIIGNNNKDEDNSPKTLNDKNFINVYGYIFLPVYKEKKT